MQWAGLGMWVALTLSACTPTKREVGNLNVIPQPQEVVQNFQENPFVILRAQKLFIRQVMKSWNGQLNFWLLI